MKTETKTKLTSLPAQTHATGRVACFGRCAHTEMQILLPKSYPIAQPPSRCHRPPREPGWATKVPSQKERRNPALESPSQDKASLFDCKQVKNYSSKHSCESWSGFCSFNT